jgi:hypothetical protein
MPAPLSTPHVPPGFPPLAIASGQIARPEGLTAPRIEVGGQTALGTEAGGPTVNLGG